MENNISKRLSWLLETKNLNATKLAQIVGIQKSSLSHILSGRNKPSFDFLFKLKQAFPDLNLDWFVTGNGEAFEKKNLNTNIEEDINKKTVEPTLFDNTEYNIPISEQKTNPVYKSKQDDINSIVFVYEDDTYKILKPRK